MEHEKVVKRTELKRNLKEESEKGGQRCGADHQLEGDFGSLPLSSGCSYPTLGYDVPDKVINFNDKQANKETHVK